MNEHYFERGSYLGIRESEFYKFKIYRLAERGSESSNESLIEFTEHLVSRDLSVKKSLINSSDHIGFIIICKGCRQDIISLNYWKRTGRMFSRNYRIDSITCEWSLVSEEEVLCRGPIKRIRLYEEQLYSSLWKTTGRKRQYLNSSLRDPLHSMVLG